MSFVIRYKVEIAEAGSAGGGLLQTIGSTLASLAGASLPLTVSNDILGGFLVVDAEITVTMTDGASADTFEVALINLPTPVTDLIRATQARTPLNVTIHLGYFDEPVATFTGGDRVLVGRVMSVKAAVDRDGFGRTILYGQEEAGYLLRNTPAQFDAPATTTAAAFATTLINRAGVQIAPGSTLGGDLTGFTMRTGSTLDALRNLADRDGSPMVVRDGKVVLGAAVGQLDGDGPLSFDPDSNIVSLTLDNAEDTVDRSPPRVRTTANLVVLGDPRLRVGQFATIAGLSGVPTTPLRIAKVVHQFGISSGYTAELRLIAAGPGERAQVNTGAQGLVDRWREVVERSHDDRPAIDVGEVTEYAAGADGKHLATIHYAQTPEKSVVSPSVASPVDTTDSLHDKPIASVFAFDRTGLVVPVYPKMRALLAHNRGLVNDAVLAGFIWPENPLLRRPANEPGDWWLALPTDLDSDGLPTGPGANDLTDASGHRVIQAAGLHIVVGADALPDVGVRPDPPTDASITIEHHSGTTITIDADGGITITTSDKPITLSNGSVSLSLDGSAVAVS